MGNLGRNYPERERHGNGGSIFWRVVSSGKSRVCVSYGEMEMTRCSVEMDKRYAPFADWRSILDEASTTEASAERYWRTPQEIHALHSEGDLPLKGLRLVLDSGHVGGQWASHEQREFRISERDFYVREAELTLEVAQRVSTQLTELGAEVTLLREDLVPVNPKRPIDYLQEVMEQLPFPDTHTPDTCRGYAEAVRRKVLRKALITGELTERARLINTVIQPDALISVHMNAAAWPGAAEDVSADVLRLVDSNDLHVLIFGCMDEGELRSEEQQACLVAKLNNGSGAVEQWLGNTLSKSMAAAMQLPPATYEKQNAILLAAEEPYVFARNLMILRMAECPTVLLEPYIVNSKPVYSRIQSALANRAEEKALASDDILVEYANAIVTGMLKAYTSI